MKHAFIVLLVAIGAAPALAQEPIPIDQSKLYLSSPEACQAAEAGSMPEGDYQNLRLADGAVQFSEEAYCSFYSVQSSIGGWDTDLLATAICNFGGMKFADTFIISALDDKTISLTSSNEATNDLVYNATAAQGEAMSTPEPTTFTRCALDGFPSP